MERYHILIADDDRSILTLAQKLLEAQGVSTISCRDGQEAIEYLQVCRFDLIVTDESMPRKNGSELAVWLRDNSNLKDVPLLLMSGEPADKAIKELLQVGTITGFIAKPFQCRNFVSRIYRLLRDAREVKRTKQGI